MANLTGKTLGKYKLTELLGSGGMAEVYKGYHPTLDRFVTIKVLHGFLAEGQDFLARFQREARAVASLRHPHIQQIHDFDVEDDQYYMVMEFVDWGSLQDLMKEQAQTGHYLPIERVLSIMQQVSAALDYAHQRGIIHRDIKPSNILLDSAGNAFLSDFGIARIMSGTQFTATGSLIGTPTYMSPEQGRGDELTPVSDIYSLGVILYELLTGKVPFTSDTTPLAIIHQHINNPPPRPRALRPDLPETAEGVILKALAKTPQERYQSAGEMVQALEKALPVEAITRLDAAPEKGQGSIATQPTELIELATAGAVTLPPPPPAQPPTGVSDLPPTPGPADQESGKRSVLAWILTGLVGVLVVGAILGIFWTKLFPAPLRPAASATPELAPTIPGATLPTALPSPTATPEAPSPTAAPTVPSLTPTPATAVIDNFNDPAYAGDFNHNLWIRWGQSNETITQHDGLLDMTLPSAGNPSLSAIKYDNTPLQGPMYLEAMVRLVSNAGAADLIIGGSTFRVVCELYGQNGKSETANCFGGASTTAALGKVTLTRPHEWHKLRLEVYPDKMTFSWSLDDQAISSSTPPSAMDYQNAPFTFRIGVDNNGQVSTATEAEFSAVKIDLIGK